MDLANVTYSKWVICRICLKNSNGEMVKIFDKSDLDLLTKIEECGGVVLNPAPNLPDSICNKCLTLLKAATKFREKIQRSEAELSEKFLLKMTPHNHNIDIQKECQEFITLNKSQSEENNGQHKATNTSEFVVPDNVHSVHNELVYSVEYQDAQSDIIRVDESINDPSFESLKHNDKLIDYVDQDMDDLELVLNVEGEKDASSFKIVPQFTTATTSKVKQLPPTIRQRRRRTVLDVGNVKTSHVCPYCGNSYAEKAKLSLHMKIHTKEKPHQCEICFKRFGQTPQLARHMNSHTGSRPFCCSYCSASFADPSTRIKHERIHTNERPYQCTVCEKAFSYSNVLKVHMMTHTGEKPHICKYCGKQFMQAHHKKKHERLHENTNLKLKKTGGDSLAII